MRSRPFSIIIATSALLLIHHRLDAALTAYWVPVSISAAAIAEVPELANMQCWDLYVSYSDGDWASAGMRLELPAGATFWHHPLGSNTRPSPAIVAAFPALAHDTYVTAPPDTGSSGSPSILGGFPEGSPLSFGGENDPLPGKLSVSWGDLITSPPGTYPILRITFPMGMIPNFYGQTSTVNPDMTIIIEIPEPATALTALGLLGLLRRRGSRRG